MYEALFPTDSPGSRFGYAEPASRKLTPDVGLDRAARIPEIDARFKGFVT
jgi:hypothetical protein